MTRFIDKIQLVSENINYMKNEQQEEDWILFEGTFKGKTMKGIHKQSYLL